MHSQHNNSERVLIVCAILNPSSHLSPAKSKHTLSNLMTDLAPSIGSIAADSSRCVAVVPIGHDIAPEQWSTLGFHFFSSPSCEGVCIHD